MGNDHSDLKDPHFYDDININKFRTIRPSLSETEIKQIYRMFHSFDPKNGLIRSDELLKKYKIGPECDDLQRCANK